MFDKILNFFIENYKINYTLFFLIFALGVYSYTKIPKEISPYIEPNTVSIRGKYSGASIDILNKMAVQEIESEVKSISGIETISSGRFSISLELETNADKIKSFRRSKRCMECPLLTRQLQPSKNLLF